MMYLLPWVAAMASIVVPMANGLAEVERKRSTTAQAVLPTVTLDAGIIIGTTTSIPSATVSVHQFLGVPFAVSPPKRFSPPEKVKPWTIPKNTTTRAPACMEQFMGDAEAVNITKTVFAYPDSVESEDCLYLNIFVPATPTQNKAVMNWLFPGNLLFGDSSRPQYDGSSLASFQDVIVVAGNYRTNVFGFSNSPEIPITERNAGFYDQRLILDWIQRNIAAFGGSPDKVLIFGESSGASSVDRLVTTNNAPFHAAIAQSGSASVSAFPDYYTTSWPTLVNLTNCSTALSQLACVRSVDAFTIKDIIESNALTFGPENDNITQLATPNLYRRTQHLSSSVPYMIGTNGGEGYPFMIGFDDLDTAINYDLYNPTASQISAIEAAYPITTTTDPTTNTTTTNIYDVVSQLFTDVYFTCPAGLIARTTATAASQPIYRYLFNQSYPNLQVLLPAIDLHSYHTIECSLVFGTYPTHNATPAQIQMSAYLQRVWADFAKDPVAGTGWRTVGGANESFDSDVRDIAEFVTLDGDGVEAGVRMRSERELDGRCGLFEAFYEGITYPAF